MCTHKWAVLRRGIPRAAIGRPRVVTLITLLARDYRRVRMYTRTRVHVCARTLRNAPPPSWVVGVGTALAGNIGACVLVPTYTRARALTRACMCVFAHIARSAICATIRRTCSSRAGSRFFETQSGERKVSREEDQVAANYRDGSRARSGCSTSSPDERELYGNSVELIRRDRCASAETRRPRPCSTPCESGRTRFDSTANLCNAVTRKVFLPPTIPLRLTNRNDPSRVSPQLRRARVFGQEWTLHSTSRGRSSYG